MNFARLIGAVFFKKCCFCGKKIKFKDKITTNIFNKKLAHHNCYLEKIKKMQNYFNKNVDMESCVPQAMGL
ncbi:MAG: hypothetical protein WCP39_07605 [Chlamydiota bacterium]